MSPAFPRFVNVWEYVAVSPGRPLPARSGVNSTLTTRVVVTVVVSVATSHTFPSRPEVAVTTVTSTVLTPAPAGAVTLTNTSRFSPTPSDTGDAGDTETLHPCPERAANVKSSLDVPRLLNVCV